MAFPLWFTELISSGQDGHTASPSAPCSHIPTETPMRFHILILAILTPQTDTLLKMAFLCLRFTLLGVLFEVLASLTFPVFTVGVKGPVQTMATMCPRCWLSPLLLRHLHVTALATLHRTTQRTQVHCNPTLHSLQSQNTKARGRFFDEFEQSTTSLPSRGELQKRLHQK